MQNKACVRAHTNIALIKYWGKRDETYFLPMNSSLSLTLDKLYTDTMVSFEEDLAGDVFYLNDELQGEKETQKISAFLDLFRKEKKTTAFARVESHNHVPTAAGLASSASAFAALAGAANRALQLHLDPQTLSTFARRGSGSATRSIYGGFVEWDMGTTSDDSFAIEVDDASWDIGMVIVAVNKKAKEVSSREGMKRTVETSPFYPAWTQAAKKDIVSIKEAIAKKDFIRLGEITEANGMKMHGTMLGAEPPFSYWEPDSIRAINIVKQLRKEGIPCYVTMDAGPNVKVLCRLSQAETIKTALLSCFSADKLIITGPGAGIRELTATERSEYQWNESFEVKGWKK
ncbi:diphosphomevalonate decarboxylase [Trichococcus palustris]|uniref:diphosphomevalonate decarboxylase n=1 Tax=Trichococcus palustris TaxID=140314 RepID=A0A143Y625_9LACT|nr:diphosphomevalonate decarboxylase [Trichococcus palustris]CZQ80544.1 diphosphomevalonate decarboxylase [Trichococcus palustris]SFK64363.1 diphosphomevalonate decarboxylase [Trichococcus palustris]